MSNQQPITKTVQELIDVFKKRHAVEILPDNEGEPKVKIHEAIGKVAFVYEKIRNAIDYQEENLIRKNAIGRMLRRRIMTRERGGVIAEPLIRELIRAGYVKNKFFPESRIPDVERIINRYVLLINYTSATISSPPERNRTFNWIISVAAYEIEEYLAPSIKDDALVECMYKIIRPNIDLTEEIPSPEDRDIQIYIAIHRALIKSDQAMLRYHLIYYYAPEWRFITTEEMPLFVGKMKGLIGRIEQQIDNKMSDRLFRYVKRFSPIFTILKNVLNQHPDNTETTLADPQKLETAVREACQQRYHEVSVKLSRGVMRSIIYIFFTKTIMAFALELPYEALFLQRIKYLPLAVNVMFHPTLMFLIATSIRVPAEQNTQKIIQGIKEVVYDPAEKVILGKREGALRTSPVLNVIFTLVYFLAFLITFGVIIWLLKTLEFSIVSAFLFILFLCVISFFGLHLRNGAKELVVLNKRENIFVIVFDFLSLPILRVGRWITRHTSKVNVFMFIMDFIIEAPFKVLVETVEEWVAFQREKKDEVY